MKQLFMLMILVFAIGCSGEVPVEQAEPEEAQEPVQEENTQEEETEEQMEDKVEIEEDSVKVDLDGDSEADLEVKQDEDTTEVVLEMEDKGIEVPEDYCVVGQAYTYEGDDGSVDAKIMGFETFKGEQRCKAQASTEIESPVGTITSETTYYFDDTFKDFWVVTTTSGPNMPSQTNEVHIVDGQVQ